MRLQVEQLDELGFSLMLAGMNRAAWARLKGDGEAIGATERMRVCVVERPISKAEQDAMCAPVGIRQAV